VQKSEVIRISEVFLHRLIRTRGARLPLIGGEDVNAAADTRRHARVIFMLQSVKEIA